MRLGGGIEKSYSSPDEWMRHVKELGYSAVLAPVGSGSSAEEIQAYLHCAAQNDVVIGEVGIWRNPLSPNDEERKAAMAYSIEQLALAEELGARCCVNIAGSRGEVWDGCYADNYAGDTYALIVDSVREIIDSVKPTRTFFTLEPMPWMHPHSPEDYLQMIHDIDRPGFGVHLDYTNMINSVEKYLNSSAFLHSCYSLLGPYIKSIHAKDVLLENNLPCCIREVPPGNGTIDLGLVLRLTQQLGDDMTLFVEHLPDYDAYRSAASHIRAIAADAGVPVK